MSTTNYNTERTATRSYAPDEPVGVAECDRVADWVEGDCAQKAPAVGVVIDRRYRLDEFLGRGGFGAVYKAQDLVEEVPVAIKVLTAERREAGEWRFRRAGRLLCQLRHPGLIAGLACGAAGHLEYVAMEYLPDSQDLQQLLESSPKGLTWTDAVQYACELLDALDFLHKQGVVHRDVKPRNVLLSQRGVVLIDFDLAKQIQLDVEDSGEFNLDAMADERTRRGLTGTPLYMSPERMEGQGANPAADLYSAALVLFVLLSHKLPSDCSAVTPRTLRELRSVRRLRPPHLHTDLGLAVPKELDHYLRRALDPVPGRRFPSAAEMYEELVGILLVHG